MIRPVTYFLIITTILIGFTSCYSASEDARIIAEYKRQLRGKRDHAKITRSIVHRANWAAVGTISTDERIKGFPMVNVIAIDDNDRNGKSTGRIHFLLTDLDFTGPDWRKDNRVTFLFTDEENKNCFKNNIDPMEPTCARAMISGNVEEMHWDDKNYEDIKFAFVKRHPAAVKWNQTHNFYMCELQIENIYELDYYGGPNVITPEDYYKVDLDEKDKME